VPGLSFPPRRAGAKLAAALPLLLLTLGVRGAAAQPVHTERIATVRERADLSGAGTRIGADGRTPSQRGAKAPKANKGKKEPIGELNAELDPHSPHAVHGFEPRPGPYEDGGNIWTFGKAHAALHHVLRKVPKGDPVAASEELHAFAVENGLQYHLTVDRAAALDNATRKAVAAATTAAAEGGALGTATSTRPLNVLVIGAGFGVRLLRCLPALLEASPPAGGADDDEGTHEVVSVERDNHLSGYGDQLFSHAIGEDGRHAVRHTAMLPGEDTSLEELLESLRDNYDYRSFDLVLLEDGPDGRLGQQRQLTGLLQAGVLSSGGVVHAEGVGAGDAETEGYLELLRKGAGGNRFESDVHDIGDGGAAIISKLRRDVSGDEL